jgi:quinol monooxygenase YgiN
MITIVATLKAQPGKEGELRAALAEMVGQVKEKEAGKVTSYTLHTKDDDPSTFLFYEQYRDAEAFAAHGTTDHMKALGAKLAGVLAGRPEIGRYTQIAAI